MNAAIQPAAPQTISDTNLASCRDARAFEALMRRHNRMLYRLARSILQNDEEAEDALQKAYIAAFRNIHHFRGESRISTWLARIVMNEAYGRLRRQQRQAVVVPLAGYDRSDQTGENGMFDRGHELPDAAAHRAELRRMLERKIDELPAQFRAVFVLREIEEMSVEETAQHLNLPPVTVRTRTFRARALLRESLSRDLDVATANAFGFAG